MVEEDIAFYIMEKLSTNHLKHFMEPTMEKTSELLEYIFPLMNHIHSELCDYLERYVAVYNVPIQQATLNVLISLFT